MPFLAYTTTYRRHALNLIVRLCLCALVLPFSIQAEAHFVMSPEYKKALFVSHANVLQNTMKRKDAQQLLANAPPYSLIELLHKDANWDNDVGVQQKILNNPLAIYFKQLIDDKTYSFAEIMLTDISGALVAAYPKTTDYWQGDEAKFTRSAVSKKVHFSEPQWDDSSNAYSFFVSIPVLKNDEVIGVLISAMDVTSSYVFDMTLEELIEVSITPEE